MARILVGIPTFQRPELLQALLSSLEAQQELADKRIEIFVADNDAQLSEGYKLCVRLASGFRWKLEAAIVSQRGISAVRNAILDEALGRGADFVAMVDDDEWVEPLWLAQLLRVQASTHADVVAGPVIYQFPAPPSGAILRSGAFPLKCRPTGRVGLVEATGNVLISCDALRRANLPHFDQSFGLTGGEDKEFFLRLRAAGLSFAWANEAIASEIVPEARLQHSWILRRAFRCGNTDVRILRLHSEWKQLLVELSKVVVVIITVPVSALFLISRARRLWLLRKWWRSAGKIAAVFGTAYQAYAVPTHDLVSKSRILMRQGD